MSLGFAVLGMVVQFAINKVPNDDDLQDVSEIDTEETMTNCRRK